MAVVWRDGLAYTDAQWDVRDVLIDYSKQYLGNHISPAAQFADVECFCTGRRFRLALDEEQGAARRVCVNCGDVEWIADGGDYADEAEPEACECLCGGDAFELTIGVSLYADSNDVRWLYVGARCPACCLSGCYGDWKNEYPDADALLLRV
jgi:hypothetical protein